jgi:transcriptional regulator with XRE-family HTH domain|tara:strand:+ start:1005 stop:1385 length:381 start_codon:yes stop_codon:yes gene_type:complete
MEGNFNRHLGSKLRMRRLALGLTQTKVAQAINVTFQQIQKYEKGTNGISSLRIMQLANFLKVPVVYFFEDYPVYDNPSSDQNKIEAVESKDLNYSFLAKLFSSLSNDQKEKIFQVLRNTRSLERTA